MLGREALRYVQTDQLGTPRAVVDPTQQKAVWRWDESLEGFGDTAPNTDPDGNGQTFVFDLRFPGQRYDMASGLYYNYMRDYDPATGRYTQSDPIGLLGGINTYAYSGSMPTSAVDPLGLDFSLDPLWGAVHELSGGWDGSMDPVFAAFHNATGWEPSSSTVNFWAGLGDGASFGLTNWIRDNQGSNSAVSKCSSLYKAGDLLGGQMLPVARLAYVLKVRSLKRMFDGSLASAAAISKARDAVKWQYRGGNIFGGRWARLMGFLFQDPVSESRRAAKIAKYGDDAARIAKGATRTNWKFNSLAVLGSAAAAGNALGGCGCDN